MPKKRISVTIDSDKLKEAKKRGINVSKVFENSLEWPCSHRYQRSRKEGILECYRCGKQVKRIPCNICGGPARFHVKIQKVADKSNSRVYYVDDFICFPCLAGKVKEWQKH